MPAFLRARRGFALLLIAAGLIFCPTGLSADTLYLRNGQQVRGKVVGQSRTSITIRNERGVREYPKAEIIRVTFEAWAPPEENKPPVVSGPRPQPGDRPVASDQETSSGQDLVPGLDEIAGALDWSGRPGRFFAELGFGPLRSNRLSAFEGFRSDLQTIQPLLGADGANVEAGFPLSSRRLNGYAANGAVAWREFVFRAEFERAQGDAEFNDLTLRADRQQSSPTANTAIYSNYKTLGLKQQNQRYTLLYSIWRSEHFDLRAGAFWLRSDYRFDFILTSASQTFDPALLPTAAGLGALPGHAIQYYQRGYGPALEFDWRFANSWRLGLEWSPAFRRRGDLQWSRTDLVYAQSATVDRIRINNTPLGLRYTAYESSAAIALEYAFNDWAALRARYAYRRGWFDVETLTVSGSEYSSSSGLRIGSGPNVLQAAFLGGLIGGSIQPRDVDRSMQLTVQLKLDLSNR